jgi:PAS domain S-box-containing protein
MPLDQHPEKSLFRSKALPAVVVLLLLTALYASSLYNYFLFHSLVEISCVVISCVIFVLAWNTRSVQDNRYLLFLGIAFLYTAVPELLHTLTYKDLSVFPGRDANMATQFWIVFRYLAGLSFLIAPLYLTRPLRVGWMMAVYTIVTTLAIGSIFMQVFPACYIEGSGLTPFKIISEYIIIAIFLASLALLLRHRLKFDHTVLGLMTASILASVAAELSFTQYVSVFGSANLIGHLFLFLSFYFLYRAIIVTGVVDPSRVFFRSVKESEAKYRSLFENMIDGFAFHKIVLNEQGRPVDYIFLEVNDAFERLTGLKRDDVVGKRVMEILPGIERDPADWIGTYGRVALTGQEMRFEQHAVALNKWFSISAYSPMREHFVAIFEDITARKRAEEELRESQALLRSVSEGTDEAIFVKDRESRLLMANPATLRIIGKTAEEALGKNDAEIFSDPQIGRTILETDRRIMDLGRSEVVEETVDGPEGRRYFLSTKSPRFDEEGRVIGLIGVARDITERKRAENALRTSEEMSRAILNAANESIFYADRSYRILAANETAARRLGKTTPEIIGSHLYDFLPADLWETRKAAYEEVLKSGKAVQFEDERGGYSFEHRLYPVFGPRGDIIRFAVYSRDITERKKHELEIAGLNGRLQENVRQLEVVNKELEAFSYSVSHDLRAPLRSLEGFSRALQEDCADRLDERGRDHLVRIRTASHRMGRLIDAMLDLSRTSREELQREPVDLSALARSVAGELRKTQGDRDVEFVIDDNITVEGDFIMLRALFENLLGNAWKFTTKQKSARIEFGVSESQVSGLKSQVSNSEPATRNPQLVYYVKDNGAGFDMAFAERLFLPFQRLHSTEEFPGIGIGLATVKRIVHRHGGKIWAEGSVGKGAAFYFTL